MSEAYPPERHLLRDLDVEVEVVAEGRRSAVFRPGGGTHVELGAVLTILDLVAGSLCLEVVSPDWIATSGITFHLTRPLLAGELQLEGHLLRAGRTTTTVELRAVDRVSTQLLGEGVATFARTRRSATAPDQPPPTEPGTRFSFTDPNGAALGADGTLRDAIGCRIVDPPAGVTVTPVSGYVRNSFGGVIGGVVATVVEAAALASAGAADGDPPDRVRAEVTDVALHYLAQGRTGPVRTRASMLRSSWGRRPGQLVVRVEVFDGEHDESRRMAVAHVFTSRWA